MPKGYRKKYVPKRKYAKKTSTKKPSSVATIKKVVKRVLSKALEVKQVDVAGQTPIAPYNYSNYAAIVIPCSPYPSFLDIQQGTGQGNRIGNVIRTKLCVMTAFIAPLSYHATLNNAPRPCYIKLIFATSRDNSTVLDVASIARLFQLGNSASPPSGNMYDMIRPFNYDAWMIHKVVMLKIGSSINTGSGGIIGQSYYANNDFSFSKVIKINLTKFQPKNVKFEDNVSYPEKPIVQMIPLVCSADGTTYGNAETPFTLSYHLRYTYTDA